MNLLDYRAIFFARHLFTSFSYFVLVHNHPSGHTSFRRDLQLTKRSGGGRADSSNQFPASSLLAGFLRFQGAGLCYRGRYSGVLSRNFRKVDENSAILRIARIGTRFDGLLIAGTVSTRRTLVVWCDFPAIHGRPGDGILHIRFVPNVFAARNVLV